MATFSITALTREIESSYLSPNFSFLAALTSQWPIGYVKQLEKNNWDWDTSSLSLASTVMLDGL